MTQPPAITRILNALKLQPMTQVQLTKVLSLHINTVARCMQKLLAIRSVTFDGHPRVYRRTRA